MTASVATTATAPAAIAPRCRVRIVNHITDHTTVVESPRDRAIVWLDLVRLVHQVNRRRDETLRASIHSSAGEITLQWHTPHPWANEIAKTTLEIGQPVRDAERLILGVPTE